MMQPTYFCQIAKKLFYIEPEFNLPSLSWIFVFTFSIESLGSTYKKLIRVYSHVEACVAQWLTSQTLDLEVWGSSLAHHLVSLNK